MVSQRVVSHFEGLPQWNPHCRAQHHHQHECTAPTGERVRTWSRRVVVIQVLDEGHMRRLASLEGRGRRTNGGATAATTSQGKPHDMASEQPQGAVPSHRRAPTYHGPIFSPHRGSATIVVALAAPPRCMGANKHVCADASCTTPTAKTKHRANFIFDDTVGLVRTVKLTLI